MGDKAIGYANTGSAIVEPGKKCVKVTALRGSNVQRPCGLPGWERPLYLVKHGQV